MATTQFSSRRPSYAPSWQELEDDFVRGCAVYINVERRKAREGNYHNSSDDKPIERARIVAWVHGYAWKSWDRWENGVHNEWNWFGAYLMKSATQASHQRWHRIIRRVMKLVNERVHEVDRHRIQILDGETYPPPALRNPCAEACQQCEQIAKEWEQWLRAPHR